MISNCEITPIWTPFVATVNVANFTLHNILIDNGSFVDILFIKPFEQLNLDKRTLEPATNSLFSFSGKKIDALGKKSYMCHSPRAKRSAQKQ